MSLNSRFANLVNWTWQKLQVSKLSKSNLLLFFQSVFDIFSKNRWKFLTFDISSMKNWRLSGENKIWLVFDQYFTLRFDNWNIIDILRLANELWRLLQAIWRINSISVTKTIWHLTFNIWKLPLDNFCGLNLKFNKLFDVPHFNRLSVSQNTNKAKSARQFFFSFQDYLICFDEISEKSDYQICF